MNKLNFTISLCLFFLSFTAFSNSFNENSTLESVDIIGNDTVTMDVNQELFVCSGVLVDNGGVSGEYTNNAAATVSVENASAAGYLLNFLAFSTENCCDELTIITYQNGVEAFNQEFRGALEPFEISVPGERIEFIFGSDGSVVRPGFVINFECLDPMEVVTDFTTFTTELCFPEVTFEDLSENFPTSWTWSIDGNVVSNDQNPTIALPGFGTFDVELTACNVLGCNTISRTDYLTVDPNSAACDTLTMASGVTQSTAACEGVLVDDGGIDDTYANNVISAVNIEGPDAVGYRLNFEFLNTESCCDAFEVYTDLGNGLELFNRYAGILDPFFVEVPGSRITIAWTSDGSVIRDGFVVNYECMFPSPPIADFSGNAGNVCSSIVQVMDESRNFPDSWNWLLDGTSISTEQNPLISLSSSGTFDLELIACNAIGCDTIEQLDFINYNPALATCDTLVMEDGFATVSERCDGFIVDDGGVAGNYSNSVLATVTVVSPAAIGYEIDIADFESEGCCDELTINADFGNGLEFYAEFAGTVDSTFVIDATSIQFVWDSDGSVTDPGFVVGWSCIAGNVPPILNTSSQVANCTNMVSFDINSNNTDNVSWDFGDGNSGTGLTTSHTYATAGTYTVVATATNTFGTNTETTTVTTSYAEALFNTAASAVINTPFSVNPSSHAQGEIASISWSLNGTQVANTYDADITLTDIGDNTILLEIVDVNGCATSFSAVVNGTTMVSSEEVEWNRLISIFPNPVTDILNIQNLSSLEESYSIALQNTIGQTISVQRFANGTDKVELSLKELPAGIYVLKIESDNNDLAFRKIIKANQ